MLMLLVLKSISQLSWKMNYTHIFWDQLQEVLVYWFLSKLVSSALIFTGQTISREHVLKEAYHLKRLSTSSCLAPTYGWFKRFMGRHPRLSIRTCKKISVAMANVDLNQLTSFSHLVIWRITLCLSTNTIYCKTRQN